MSHLTIKFYKFRLYPNSEQKTLLEKTFGCCRFVYNHYLAKSIEDYETTRKSNSCNQNCKDLTHLKKDYKYTVRVRAKLSDGRESLWTQPVSFIPTIATGIDEVGSDQLPSNSDSSAIYDITGRRVTSASRPGIYIKNGKKIVIGRGK